MSPGDAAGPNLGGVQAGAETQQQGRADSSILPLGTPTWCGAHEHARYICGCAYPRIEWTQRLIRIRQRDLERAMTPVTNINLVTAGDDAS